MKAAVKGVEGGVRQPSLVKVQGVNIPIECVLDGLGVVEHAVIGALGERQDARLDGSGVLPGQQRVGGNALSDGLGCELSLRNRPDDSVVVARGRQEHRNGTRHDDRVQDRLVAVAVHHHHITGRDGVVPHHLVAGAGAIGDEKTMVGIEDACRIAFALGNRPSVVEQLPEFIHAIAHIGPQHVLAKKLVEHAPHRALQKRHAARMARAVPGVRTVLRVIDQSSKKRRCEAVHIGFGLSDDVARHELWRVFKHVDEAVQLAQDVVG